MAHLSIDPAQHALTARREVCNRFVCPADDLLWLLSLQHCCSLFRIPQIWQRPVVLLSLQAFPVSTVLYSRGYECSALRAGRHIVARVISRRLYRPQTPVKGEDRPSVVIRTLAHMRDDSATRDSASREEYFASCTCVSSTVATWANQCCTHMNCTSVLICDMLSDVGSLGSCRAFHLGSPCCIREPVCHFASWDEWRFE